MLNMKSKIFKYIYGMLCLLPAIAVGVTCLYVANNENAYQSYSGSQNSQLVSVEDYHIGERYVFDSTYLPFQSFDSGKVVFSDISDIRTSDANISNALYSQSTNVFQVFASTTNKVIQLGTISAQTGYSLMQTSVYFEFTLESFDTSVSKVDNLKLITFEYERTDYYYADNVFYYSLDKVENSSVFSWVKSNFLYDGMNSFVGIFGGTNSNISFYLTWVLTISLCYLGFEVLMLFINMARNLIHSFTDKDRW